FTDRTRDLVDRGRAGDGDADQRAVDADNGAEQTDERRGRTDGRQKRQAAVETGVDRSFRTRERAVHPVVRFERVGHLRVLRLGGEAVVDELTPGAVLLELGGPFLEGRGLPEGTVADGLVLAQDLVLLEQLGDQDVERKYRHDHEHAEDGPGDDTALFHGLPEAEGVLRGLFAAGRGQNFNKQAGSPRLGNAGKANYLPSW